MWAHKETLKSLNFYQGTIDAMHIEVSKITIDAYKLTGTIIDHQVMLRLPNNLKSLHPNFLVLAPLIFSQILWNIPYKISKARINPTLVCSRNKNNSKKSSVMGTL